MRGVKVTAGFGVRQHQGQHRGWLAKSAITGSNALVTTRQRQFPALVHQPGQW
jgi:hypothetical protein